MEDDLADLMEDDVDDVPSTSRQKKRKKAALVRDFHAIPCICFKLLQLRLHGHALVGGVDPV